MRIKSTFSAIAIAGLLGGSALMAPTAATGAGTGGTRPYPEGSQGPCSPGGIWHPDPTWPHTGGWCEYPKKKCWWSCPKPTASTPATQVTRY